LSGARPRLEELGVDVLAEGPKLRREVTLAVAVVMLSFGGFGLWSTLAPLSSAAVAPGRVVVRDKSKTVQHLEGGLIREILVHEGDLVAAGDLLLRLDDTQSHASRQVLQNRHDALSVEYARLSAELKGADSVTVPDRLVARSDEPRVDELLRGQELIFEKRRQAMQGQSSILEQRVFQLESEIASYEAKVKATDQQLAVLLEEMEGVRILVEKGYEAKPRLLQFEGERAALEGTRQSTSALVARARQEIGEARMEVTQIETNMLNEIVAQQQEVRERLAETEESLRAAADVQARREIRAPIAGTIVNLQYFTAGGVIRQGDPILDIVPAGGELIVEARVNPMDIETVREGLEATVRMTSFKQRIVPPLKGRVDYVSADALTDDRSGVAYYEAWITIYSEELEKLGGLELQPGMPADTLIITGERSLLRYVMQPFTASFHRALHEE